MNLKQIMQHTGKTIWIYSLPSILAMILTALITITDGYFTGNYVGKNAIAAMNLGLPIVYLYLGLGLLVAVGGSVIAGIALGAGEEKKSCDIFNQTVLTALVISTVISLLLVCCLKPVSIFLRCNSATLGYFTGYYRIMAFQYIFMIINNTFGMFIRIDGRPAFYLKISIFNVLANLVLDDIFSKYLGAGIEGIAFSSLLSTFLCTCFMIWYFVYKSENYHFTGFCFDKEVWKKTLMYGVPECIGEISMGITIYAYNWIIMRTIGVDGVTAFTVAGYVSFLFSMILLGFGQGISPLISFASGAGEPGLARRIRQKTNLYVFLAGLLFTCVLMALSRQYSSIFVKSDAIRDMVSFGLRIYMLSFLFSGINTITTFYFTSVGKAKEPAVISLLRGLVILMICIFVFPHFFHMTGVWMVAPVTEAATFVVAAVMIYKTDKSAAKG